jgi:hypothetical protein
MFVLWVIVGSRKDSEETVCDLFGFCWTGGFRALIKQSNIDRRRTHRSTISIQAVARIAFFSSLQANHRVIQNGTTKRTVCTLTGIA